MLTVDQAKIEQAFLEAIRRDFRKEVNENLEVGVDPHHYDSNGRKILYIKESLIKLYAGGHLVPLTFVGTYRDDDLEMRWSAVLISYDPKTEDLEYEVTEL